MALFRLCGSARLALAWAILLLAACDESAPNDLAVAHDMASSSFDFASTADLAAVADLKSSPDLTAPEDLLFDCRNGRVCPKNTSCCNGDCIDTRYDFINCGACGVACARGFNCCGGVCSDPASDVNNCGTCGNPCGSICRQPPACVKGACGGGACGNECGWADCNMNVQDGCETHIDTDTSNCGACGFVCKLANALQKCVVGKCGISSCLPGFLDCDKLPASGCEVDGTVDAGNCGACGVACGLGMKCVAGKCI